MHWNLLLPGLHPIAFLLILILFMQPSLLLAIQRFVFFFLLWDKKNSNGRTPH